MTRYLIKLEVNVVKWRRGMESGGKQIEVEATKVHQNDKMIG